MMITTIAQIRKTEAFRRRDAAWPADQWDYTEWDECALEARRELTSSEKSRNSDRPKVGMPPDEKTET